MTEKRNHLPVMAAEVVDFVITRSDGVYIDCTVGGGGHAFDILNNAPAGRLLGIDRDQNAINAASETLSPFAKRVTLLRGNFADLTTLAGDAGIDRADGILFDLGVSSLQLDDGGRGFSFSTDGPLDMRMDRDQGVTAATLLSRANVKDLASVITEFGEERRAYPIARAILRDRDDGRLRTTSDLARAIVSTKPARRTKTLARVFQAIRIAVNLELDNLMSGLEQAVPLLRAGGRICAISYHSLEDRIVKRHFVTCQRPCICPRDIPECVCGRVATLRIVTKRVVRPSESEVAANPRARAAKLRTAEKLAVEAQ